MYEVIDASCYLDEITEKIKKSKNKIYIQAMHIDFSKKFEIFIDEIIKAKKRGVDVKFNIDEYSIPYIVGHKYYHISQYKRINCNTKSEKNKYYLDKLIKEKIDIKFINEYKYGRIVSEYLPFFGRNHMKITIIDDVSFIGGINLAEKSLDYLDFMVRIKNKKLNLLLIDIFIKNRDGRKNNDITIPIDKLNDLIIDSGRRFKSQIYKETLDSIRKAEQSIIFISQFLPDFNILYALQNAQKRGISVDVITHSPYLAEKKFRNRMEHLIFNIFNIHLNSIHYTKSKYVHAKVIIIDKDSENSEIIFGSHNFSTFGVLFGTSEISLKTKEKTLMSQLINWYNEISSEYLNLIEYSSPSRFIKER